MDSDKNINAVKNDEKDDKYQLRKERADNVISKLKKELEQELNNPFQSLYSDFDDILILKNDINKTFLEALPIAKNKIIYFQNKIKEMIPIVDEYMQVSLKDKDVNFLRIFRSRVGITIRKHISCLKETDSFFSEFIKKFKEIAVKGKRLSYTESQYERISELESQYALLSQAIDNQIRFLQGLRIQSLHLIKDPKTKRGIQTR